MSCIDQGLAEQLGLPPVDLEMISGVGGPQQHAVYLTHVDIPGLELFRYGRFVAVSLAAGQQLHRANLGRDLLNQALMIYDGDRRAQVTLACKS